MRMVIVFSFLALLMTFGASGCVSFNAEKRAPMIGETINVGGVDMHVLTAGPRESAKPPVVLIHGASVNLRDMKIALGDQLSKDRLVVMIDRPGRGYSSRPKNGYALNEQARLIHGVVEALGVSRPVLVGQSLGGAVALRYALNYQDSMHGLVLLAPVSHEWPGGVAWHNHVSDTPVLGAVFRRLVVPIYATFVAKGAVQESFSPDSAPDNYFEESGLALLFRAKDFQSNASDVVHLESEIREQQDLYGNLHLPVAIVTGESDVTVSPEIHAKTLNKQVATSELTLIPDTGHALHHSQTDKIIEIIDEISAAR